MTDSSLGEITKINNRSVTTLVESKFVITDWRSLKASAEYSHSRVSQKFFGWFTDRSADTFTFGVSLLG